MTTQKNIKGEKWRAIWGVAIFVGKKKVQELSFKNEMEMVYWLYKNKFYEKH